MNCLIGCSGYHYREWKGLFYPEGLPASQWLRHYAEHFNTIEINATFYRMPTLKSLSKRYADTPADFAFAVKAPRLFTHFRRMNGIAKEQGDFYDTCFAALQEKLRCVLYQFPATMKFSQALLDAILKLADIPVLHAIEFRDASWWRADVYAALQEAGLIFVNISLPDFEDVFVPDAKTLYLRFHGKPVLYKSSYGAQGLQTWTDAIRAHPPQQLFAYFNNTWFGEAITDARHFRAMLGA